MDECKQMRPPYIRYLADTVEHCQYEANASIFIHLYSSSTQELE